MSTEEGSPPGGETRFGARASESARIYQAAHDQYVAERDLHLHYETGVRRARRALVDSAPDAECPYPGLAAFDEDQSRWFFGRDAVTADLLVRLDERLHEGGVLAVVAPSGAGKSSLLRAGLLPALARGALPAPGSAYWPRLLVTPTADPMAALSARLAQAVGVNPHRAGSGPQEYAAEVLAALGAGSPPSRRLVLVVDQLEELFTLCANERDRQDFLDVLTALARPHPAGGGPVILVVLGLRSDFYTPCADYPQLRSALQDRQLVVGSMTQTELREAIVFPAQAVGLDLEPGLVEVLLRDLGAHTDGGRLLGAEAPQGYEAGRLPLLAHALRATWQQRHGHSLTVEAYQSTGGIRNAVTTTADRIFTSLDPDGQRFARTLFLRLVKIGDGVEDTRRRLPRDDLLGTASDATGMTAVITAFTRGRLLTQHQETVEITHEALLQAWPRLRSWIEADRSGHLVHQRLEEAATAWRDAQHDTSVLYRGQRLETARAWANRDGQDQASAVACAFLAASVQHAQRGMRIRRAAIAILVALGVLAATAAVVALQQRSTAQAQRDEAVFSRVKAEGGALRESQASLAAQLNLVALGMRPEDAALRTRLIEDASQPLSEPLDGAKGPYECIAFSHDGALLAAGSEDGSVQLWRFSGSSKAKLIGHTRSDSSGGPVNAVAMSADGRLLATANNDGSQRLFDISDATHPRPLGHTPPREAPSAVGVDVSPDGKLMASATEDAWADLWDISNPRRPRLLGRAKDVDTYALVGSVAISSTGRYLATTGGDGNVQLWDIRHPAAPVRLGWITDFPHSTALPITPQGTAVFSPDEKTLASGGNDGMVRLWDISDKRHPSLLGLPLPNNLSPTTGLAFSPDGRTLATSSSKDSVYIFNLADLTNVHLMQTLHGNLLGGRALAFRPNDDSLVTVGPDPAAPLWWHLRPTVINRHQGLVSSESFARDDGSMITVGNDGMICRWNLRSASQPVLLDCGRFENPSRGSFNDTWLDAVAVSPDGRTMALVDNESGKMELWDIAAIRHAKKLKTLADSHGSYFRNLSFSPDGHVLAAAGDQGAPQLWDVSDPRHIKLLGRFAQDDNAPSADQLAFSPDGGLVATLDDADGRVVLWNVTDPRYPIQAGHTKRNEHDDEYSMAMAFSPTGDLIATASDSGRIRLWSVTRSGTLSVKGTATTATPTPTGAFTTLSFSPDKHLLATGGSDNTIRLWDVSDPAHPAAFGLPLAGHTRAVHAVVFDPTSPVLVSDSYDGTVRLWPTEISYDTNLVCRASAGTLTPAQWNLHLSGLPYDPPCP
ncbi:AAA family ATPase [Streptomyces sp. R35]|uniref:AAA family ATPase n=1 Tax=Streptomyces sp. R35 TaxID=3238630 RepID=A0AB39S5D6_9ACTN